MEFTLLAFLVFAAVTVVSAVAVISVRNPVHAALFLVLTFFTVACTWILAGAEFLGVALILVYVGAVMVLFLFVVMMLDIDVAPLREGYVRYLPVGLLVAGVMLAEMLTLIGIRSRTAPFGPDVAEAAGLSNTAWVAHRLFTDYLLPFEVAALILTVAVIAAVMLALRRREGTKHQSPGAQSAVRAADRFRLVKMASEPPRSTQAPPPDGQAPEGEGKA
ncbi:NADH-quinone oxidoreductase subunit J [Luteimonas sp. RD2P54]|uniref:NADH-quinone oxidoreductase subunit J n=1 Tax=Luteimonas endophytica TaxID=3042023 RepID=A0ABT6JBB1_9GAMM|nr:NADH-quinone oxidoreductase subunit J [Luteimonas endophytica]MDH5823468.1 NADH-quinone oxidoreductase subunit J [Luteimonas endophytica]